MYVLHNRTGLKPIRLIALNWAHAYHRLVQVHKTLHVLYKLGPAPSKVGPGSK